MRNTKEIQPILASIFVLNRCSKNENPDIANLCEYALRRCLDANTNLLVLGTTGVSYEDAKAQVAQIIKEETAYKKVMGQSFYSPTKK